MKVWLVGIADCEGSSITHICKTKQLALKRLFEERDKLVKEWKESIEFFKKEDRKDNVEDYLNMIKKLSTDDYKKWSNNDPQDYPYMYEMELEEEE